MQEGSNSSLVVASVRLESSLREHFTHSNIIAAVWSRPIAALLLLRARSLHTPKLPSISQPLRRTLFASGCKAFRRVNLLRRLTTWEFTCFHPDRMLYERCFIFRLQTRTSSVPANSSAKHCGNCNISLKKTV